MVGKMSPSLMCVDLMSVEKEIRNLEKNNVDYFHLDIMDHSFVPNITLGFDFIKQLKSITRIPLDVHLMVSNTDLCLPFLNVLDENDIITFHYESTLHINKTIQSIKKIGCKVGIAINPTTTLESLKYIIPDIDMILIMTVNPGFAGQKLIDGMIPKINETRKFIDLNKPEVLLSVDGNVSFENAIKMRKAGADVFVGGSSSIFSKEDSIENNCIRFREIISSERGI